MRIASTYPLRDIIEMVTQEMFHTERDEVRAEFVSHGGKPVHYEIECEMRVLRDGTKSLQLDIKRA